MAACTMRGIEFLSIPELVGQGKAMFGKDQRAIKISNSDNRNKTKKIYKKLAHKTSYFFYFHNNSGGKKNQQHTSQDDLHLDGKRPHPGIEVQPVSETEECCRE
jgi:hypothetical protein